MTINYMARPSEVYRQWLQAPEQRVLGQGGDVRSFEAGRIAVALELVGVVKTLDHAGGAGLTDRERAAVSSTVVTLLDDLSLRDRAWELYDQLCSWRRTDIRPEGTVSDAGSGVHRPGTTSSGLWIVPVASRPSTFASDALLHEGLASRSDGSSFPDVAPGSALLQHGRTRLADVVRQSPDSSAIDGQSEPLV